MSQNLDLLKVRRAKAVTVCGQSLFVRALTRREAAKLDSLPNADTMPFIAATCVCDGEGHPTTTVDDWDDVPMDSLMELIGTIRRVSESPDIEELAKN